MRGQSINAEFARLWEPPLVISWFSRNVGWAIITSYVVFLGIRVWRIRSVPKDAVLGVTAVLGALLFQRNLFLLLIPMEQMLLAWSQRETKTNPRLIATLTAAALLAATGYNAKWLPTHSNVLAMPAYWRRHISPTANPVGCLDAVQRLPEGSRVFTTHLWASFLIERARNTRIFVDGRNREYPLAIHRAAFQIERGGVESLQLLDASGTQWVLADPGWLSRVPGSAWQMQGRSENCALFARTALRE